MAQYIDKDAIVAEIERHRKIYMYDVDNKHSFGSMVECNDLLVFLDTLEVKEMEEVPATVMEEILAKLKTLQYEYEKDYKYARDKEDYIYARGKCDAMRIVIKLVESFKKR